MANNRRIGQHPYVTAEQRDKQIQRLQRTLAEGKSAIEILRRVIMDVESRLREISENSKVVGSGNGQAKPTR